MKAHHTTCPKRLLVRSGCVWRSRYKAIPIVKKILYSPCLDTSSGEPRLLLVWRRSPYTLIQCVAFWVAAIGFMASAYGAEARLTSTELATEMAAVVQQLQSIAASATSVSNNVASLRAEADRYFAHSTNTALSIVERNRAFAQGLDKLADAVIETEKFIRDKGRTMTEVRARLRDITTSATALNSVALPKIDFERLAADMRRADESLGDLVGDEEVSADIADAFIDARDAALDDQGFENDMLPKFLIELRQLSRQVAKEEFGVAQASLRNRRLLGWIAIKAMQGQINLVNASNPLPSISAKDLSWNGTLAKFAPPKPGQAGTSNVDDRAPRVSAASILKN